MKPSWTPTRIRHARMVGIIGGILGILLAPIMVAIKYLTGWNIIPQPSWIDAMRPILDLILFLDSPSQLWMIYGAIYSVALILMLIGLLALWPLIKNRSNKAMKIGYWILIIGLCLVIPGDAVHTMTWHQNGLTKPTPGSNPVANTGYAVAMMGMNFVLIGSLTLGIAALVKRNLVRWLAWLFILITPAAVILSTTLLPTTPSGGLWWFGLIMICTGQLKNLIISSPPYPLSPST